MQRLGVTQFLGSLDSGYRALSDISPDLHVWLDESGSIVRVNPAFEHRLDRCEADVLGNHFVVYVLGRDIDTFLHAFVGKLPSDLFNLLHAGHGLVPVRLVAFTFRDAGRHGYLILRPAVVHETSADWARVNWSA